MESLVATGLEVCLADPPAPLRGARFGLLLNQASVARSFALAHERLAARFPGRLAALFSPQHGLFAEQQDNMVESPHGIDPRTGAKTWSLYSETRKPRPEMLAGLDALVVDLQDVGCRVYTFVWTLSLCLEACAAAKIAVVVLDRPNPIGGEQVEGARLDPAFTSFVGRAPIPMRHALTMGELARHVNATLRIGAELHVVPMRGWRRTMRLDATGIPWVPTSPNLPRLEGVAVYPGQVLLEGTNLSEGRGTTTPFELCGAPFVDPWRLRDELARFELEGVTFRPLRFVPTFHKWKGESCGGLFLHVTDPERFRPVRTSVALLASVRRLWPKDLGWKPPPYEYEWERLPIDLIAGGSTLRAAIDAGGLARGGDLDALCDADAAAWRRETEASRLYD